MGYISKKIKKKKNRIKKVFQNVFFGAETKSYIENNKKLWISNQSEKDANSDLILIDLIETAPVYNTFAYIGNYLKKQFPAAQLESFSFYFDMTKKERLLKRRLNKIYNSFGVFEQAALHYNKDRYYAKAKQIVKTMESKQDILSFEYAGVFLGDLLYDTILRYEKIPTVDIDSPKINDYIADTMMIADQCYEIFDKQNIRAVVVGDIAYVYSGAIARVAAKYQVPVINFTEAVGFLPNVIDPETFHRRKRYYNYHSVFDSFSKDVKDKSMELSKEKLEQKFSGTFECLPYMDKKRGSNKSVKINYKKGNKPKILILLHCFFDSPHIYRDMLFADFWEWLDYTLSIAQETDFEWLIKPHPNGYKGNDEIINSFQKKYPYVTIVSAFASNTELINDGVKSVFTVYGTAIYEMAYLDIPVVSVGDNPCANYNFFLKVQSLSEYKKMIINADRLECMVDKNEIYEFFYMHYLHYKPFAELSPVYLTEEIESFLHLDSDLDARSKRISYLKSSKILDFFTKQNNEGFKSKVFNYLDNTILDDLKSIMKE